MRTTTEDLGRSTGGARATASRVEAELRPDGVLVLRVGLLTGTALLATPFLRDLETALDAHETRDEVRAIVVSLTAEGHDRTSFPLTADAELLRGQRFAEDASALSTRATRTFARLHAHRRKPAVAWVHGTVLGGGFELALACTAIVMSQDEETTVGLPEVKLGLSPAAGGLFRLAGRAGLRVALDLGTTGRALRPGQALSLGVVDALATPSDGLEAACALASRLAHNRAFAITLGFRRLRATGPGWVRRASVRVLERTPIGRPKFFRRARGDLRAKTRGHRPAAERAVDLLERFAARGHRAASTLASRVFGDLVVSETAHRLIDLHLAERALVKDSGLDPSEEVEASTPRHVAVVGAGYMGAAIASISAGAGLSVRLKDTDEATVLRALAHVRIGLAERTLRGELEPREREATASRIVTATDYGAFREAELVVEAAFEDLSLKHRILRDVEREVRDTCVVASSTSALSIAQIAEVARHPERVVGMHYGSPPDRLRLLEVVRAPQTVPSAIAAAVALGRRQGKRVIVVRDGPGFFTTRILTPYVNEALHLLAEGASVEAIDRALLDWGFPVGPLQLLDEVGIDLGARVATLTGSAFGERLRPPAAYVPLTADGRRGRRNARGFYLYGRGHKVPLADPSVYGLLGLAIPKAGRPGGGGRPSGGAVPADEIALRCALAMVHEALRCLDEGVVRSARDGDVGAVLGVGFPAFRGGPFRYVEVLGAPEILRRSRSLEQRFGARFEPAPLLVALARTGRHLYGQ